jgi:hypothetical protein
MPPPSRDEGWEELSPPERLEELVPGGGAPIAVLHSPEVGTRYHAGGVITFEGRGLDAEDGALPASAFTWRVDVHAGNRTHSFVPPISGMASGSFTVPELAEAQSVMWYRIHLQVKDSQGNTHAVFRDVYPGEKTASARRVR